MTQFFPVTVNGSSTPDAAGRPVIRSPVGPGFAEPGTLMVAPPMTPSPFARTAVTVRPAPKRPVTVSFGANPVPSTVIAVPRGPALTDSVTCGWYAGRCAWSATRTVAVA